MCSCVRVVIRVSRRSRLGCHDECVRYKSGRFIASTWSCGQVDTVKCTLRQCAIVFALYVCTNALIDDFSFVFRTVFLSSFNFIFSFVRVRSFSFFLLLSVVLVAVSFMQLFGHSFAVAITFSEQRRL